MAALGTFLRDELLRRDWSVEEFAHRADISTSLGYQIIRDGKDNVRQDTFDGIASALSMAPADLMVAIGKGQPHDDVKRAPIHAAIREIPEEQLGLADRMLRILIPSSNVGAAAPPNVGKRGTRIVRPARPEPEIQSGHRGFALAI